MSRFSFRVGLVCLGAVALLAVLHGPCSFAKDSALLDRTIVVHRAARESIRTLQAQFKAEMILPSPSDWGPATVTYLRSPDGVLIRSGKEGAETSHTFLVKNGETRSVNRSVPKGKPLTVRASRMSGTQMLAPVDAWQSMLLATYGPNQQTLPFEQYIEAASSVRATTARVDGREIITVVVRIGTDAELRVYEYQFDERVNYLIRKVTGSAPQFDEHSEAEIVRFLEPQPGVFVPVQRRSRSYKGDKLDQEMLHTLSDVVVNAPIPAERFELPAIPSSTELVDRLTHTRYPIDENWNRIGPEAPNR